MGTKLGFNHYRIVHGDGFIIRVSYVSPLRCLMNISDPYGRSNRQMKLDPKPGSRTEANSLDESNGNPRLAYNR